VLRRYLFGFWGRYKSVEDFPFFSQGEAVMRHLRGDDRNDLVSIIVFVALLIYLAWATWFGPLAPFITMIDPVPGESGGARVVQFGLLAYLIGRVTRFRFYAYVGVFAILWSGIAALNLGSWGSFAQGSPAQTGGFSEIAGAGAATALFLHRLANFLGPHVIVPGVGLIACEVIRMLVDPLRERIAVSLAVSPAGQGAASTRDSRPRWLMPTTAGASMLVAIMVVLASWGGSGAAIVDAMARRTVQTHASPAGVILRMAALAPASVAGGRLTMLSVQFVNWHDVGAESTSITSTQAPPAAIVQARLDLPAGGMREVSYQVFHDAAGARIVLQLSPLIRLAEANVYQTASPALGADTGRSDDEAVFAGLKSHIETTVSGAPNVEDFSGITFTTAPERPFLYVRGTEFSNDGGAGANAALATANATLERAGLTTYGEAIIVRLPGGSFLAGYAYEDFGETVDATTLGEAQLGRTPAGQALQLRYSGAETGASAAQQRLLAAAQSAGLQNGTLVEQRSGDLATPIAAELDDVAGEGAVVPQVLRDYYLLVTGPASNLGCVLGAIGSGVGYCDLNQPTH
jgi:hypothetical protein